MKDLFFNLQYEGRAYKLPWKTLSLKGKDATSYFHRQITNEVEKTLDKKAQLGTLLDKVGRLLSYFYYYKSDGEIIVIVPSDLFEKNV